MLAACTAIGLFNGLVVERLGLNSIIATLAVGTGLRGLTFLVFGTEQRRRPPISRSSKSPALRSSA